MTNNNNSWKKEYAELYGKSRKHTPMGSIDYFKSVDFIESLISQVQEETRSQTLQEVEEKIPKEEKPETNTFSNRNLTYTDGYNQARKDFLSAIKQEEV